MAFSIADIIKQQVNSAAGGVQIPSDLQSKVLGGLSDSILGSLTQTATSRGGVNVITDLLNGKTSVAKSPVTSLAGNIFTNSVLKNLNLGKAANASLLAGRVEVGGTDVTAMSAAAATRFRRRHVGVVFQSFNLVETLDVAENVALPVRLDRGRPDAARLAALLARLGLAGKERRRPSELSGGERQRVAVARALFAQPDVVLADEPTGNLDISAARGICALLRELHAAERSAILLVAHDPVVAAAADRVHFLRDGVVAASFDTGHDPAAISARYLEFHR